MICVAGVLCILAKNSHNDNSIKRKPKKISFNFSCLTLHNCYGYRRTEANYLLVERISGQAIKQIEEII